jgi:protein involved in polysaccharide export with SLBB domain
MLAAPLQAQEQPPGAVPGAPVAGGRTGATRAELEANLAEIERALASGGVYSPSVVDAKRAEATMIRERLEDGDFQAGDQLDLTVTGEAPLSGKFTVGTGRVLQLPGLPEIPLKGVLRSEGTAYVKEQIGRFVRDPDVRLATTIRLSMFGAIGKPGFYQLPADMILSDALMAAGGPSGNVHETVIKRGTDEIWGVDAVQEAITAGRTLDELNLRAGDEINVPPGKTSNWFTTLRTIAIIPGLILSTYGIAKLLGIF